jgi:PAS domain-containing protein
LEGYLPTLRSVTMHNLNNDHAGRIRLRAMREREQWTTAIAVLLVAVLGLLVVVLVHGESSARWFLARIRSTKAEAERAQQRLAEAIEGIDEGVALFDAADRLVLCNLHYRQLYGPVADRVVPGARFADLLRAVIEAGHLERPDDVEGFIADQVRHRWSAQENSRDTVPMHGR